MYCCLRPSRLKILNGKKAEAPKVEEPEATPTAEEKPEEKAKT